MKEIWLIGTGFMGIEYAKVLNKLNIEYIAIGRGEKNAKNFENQINHSVVRGGLEKFISKNHRKTHAAIVAVGLESLAQTTKQLVDIGIENILLEKPGALNHIEIIDLLKHVNKFKNNILIAYNRRFFASVLKAERIIKQDGGVTSFCFEFTEWSHIIKKLNEKKNVLNNWFICNSTHVVDTAFFLGGKPKIIYSLQKGGINWHPSSSIFAGVGESENGALFSYHANWEAPGRWVIEMLTKKHRLFFKPMEILQIQELNSVDIKIVEINDILDKEFKPGIYLQTKSFIENDYKRFCTLHEQKEMFEKYYLKMCGYKRN